MTEIDKFEIYSLIDQLHKIAESQRVHGGVLHMAANTIEVLLEEIQELEQLMYEE